ncbi:hypothetical protein P280DRAFT_5240 [Massarina eburnea CBS 473.64]|uniref:Uncharacterized protein n=1 Tax=Massarina eburnea CBS 473.64 TaxID=1395130 RepID=A0A6A6SEA6_9PLEO|nr:hypothetical protein P280DRAFT_5240 [Massarina eburnea CBS 473.64]
MSRTLQFLPHLHERSVGECATRDASESCSGRRITSEKKPSSLVTNPFTPYYVCVLVSFLIHTYIYKPNPKTSSDRITAYTLQTGGISSSKADTASGHSFHARHTSTQHDKT